MADIDPQRTVEHLKLVQGVVSRMAGNSANMKTLSIWAVGLPHVYSGLSDDPHWLIGLGACIPVIAFWSMDARYLHLERCYVKLYEAVASDTPVEAFSLNYRPHVGTVGSVWSAAWSWSVCRFYGALLAALLALVGILLPTGT